MKVTQNTIKYPLHHVIYASTKFEVASSNSLGEDAFTIKYIIWPLSLGSRSNKTSPSTLYIMWSMHLQSLKLLRPTVQEMHLQENTFFDLWPWHRGQDHMKCCPVTPTSCDLCTCQVWSCYIQQFRRCIYKKIYYLTFDLDLGIKVTWNVAHRPVPSSSCDLCIYKVWSCCIQLFRRYNYKKRDGWTDRRTGGRRTDFGAKPQCYKWGRQISGNCSYKSCLI